jgi:predicted nucleic acid-binding protein
MPYLLDTMVISELRKKNSNKNVVQWLQHIPADQLYLSAITIGEIENGITRQERVNPSFAHDLKVWLETLLQRYAENILTFSTPIARRWGRLCGELGRADADLMLAATALEHRLIVVTRNEKHFAPTQVEMVNPFEADNPRPSV